MHRPIGWCILFFLLLLLLDLPLLYNSSFIMYVEKWISVSSHTRTHNSNKITLKKSSLIHTNRCLVALLVLAFGLTLVTIGVYNLVDSFKLRYSSGEMYAILAQADSIEAEGKKMATISQTDISRDRITRIYSAVSHNAEATQRFVDRVERYHSKVSWAWILIVGGFIPLAVFVTWVFTAASIPVLGERLRRPRSVCTKPPGPFLATEM